MGFLLSVLLFSHSLFSLNDAGSDDSTYHAHTFVLGVNYGTIWAHNPPVAHLAQSHPWQISAEYLRLSPQKEWSRSYHNPYFGLELQYFNYQSPVLGSSLAGVVFLEPVLYNRFRYRIGTGAVANFKPFNLESNTTNSMIGSHFAFVMQAQINYYQPISKKLQVRFALGLTHFSNGAFAQPNAGINNFFVGAALCRRSKALPWPKKTIDSAVFRKGFSWILGTSFSLVENFPVDGPKYPIYHVIGRCQYRVGRKSSPLIGLDYIRNMALAKKLEDDPSLGTEIGRVGLILGHELHISKVSLMTELGIYIRKKQVPDPNSYQRYGLRYYWTPHLFTGWYLKTHKARAECIEWALGWKFG